METNHNEVWPFNLLCRIFDPEALEDLKADPPVELEAFLVYVIRDMYCAVEVDMILMHFMAQLPMDLIIKVTQLPEEEIIDVLDAVGEKLRDPILMETFQKGLAWRVEIEKQKAYLEGYRRGYTYAGMDPEEVPSNGGNTFTDWFFDLPGHDHPIEFLDPPEDIYSILYFAGIRTVNQLLEADDKKLMIEYRLEPDVINEIAGVLYDKGYCCPITMGRKAHVLSTPEGKQLIASLSESTAHQLRYYMPADLMQTFLFVKQLALDSNEAALLFLYYDLDMPYQEVAEKMEMEAAQVRIIVARALRKLRDPRCIFMIRCGLKGTVREMIRMESECGFQDGFNRGAEDRSRGESEYAFPEALMEKLQKIPVDHLDLSFKINFLFHRNNLETIADVIQAQDTDLLAIKGIGRTVLQRIRQKQQEYVRELWSDMATEEIAVIWESKRAADEETP